MEAKFFRKWFKTNIYHSKTPSHSSDCVISTAPGTHLSSEISNAVLATPADASTSPPTTSAAIAAETSTASPRLSFVTKKGKGKSAEDGSGLTEPNGFHLIHQLPQDRMDTISLEKQCPIDIVAVHGINGGAYTTWTHSNEHFWLRDSLPEVVPGARIFSYGYPAKVFFSLEKGRIDDHARALLEDLLDVRRSPEEQRRPIIFICHSMGGIVVKKAINMTVVDPGRYSNIQASTAAIFFLATPHCGADPAKMLSVCADIMNLPLAGLTLFSGKMRSDMIKTLAPGSTTLLDISSDFKGHTANIRIYSFIEQKSTPPSSGKIVDDMSGRMNVPGEVVVPMPGCNHREVAKFASKDTNGYQKIVNKLTEVTSEITNKLVATLQAEDIPCLSSLTYPSMSHRLSSLSSAQPDTCTWILSHPSFISWTSSTAAQQIIYIKGHPGTGKSTLMSFLHHFYLQQPIQYRFILLSFFFHGNGDALEKSQLGMFRSLVVQLYKQSLSARRAILAAYNEKKANTGQGTVVWSLKELQMLLQGILTSESMREKEIMVLVDALDEATDEGEKAATQLLEFFHLMNDARALVSGKCGKIKICISCRQYPIVAVEWGALQISIQAENRRDIEKYVSSHLSRLVQDWHLEPQALRTELEKAIVDKADGVFLWVVKRLARIVDDLNDGVIAFEDLKSSLETESSDLFALYDNILTRDVKKGVWEKALLFMQWICLSERPLSLVEIRMAMASDETYMKDGQERVEESKEYVKSNETMEKLIRSLSGGLAEVRHGTVQLFHQSVTDFLRARGIRTLLSGTSDLDLEDWTDEQILGTSHDRLSKSCFQYLGLGGVAKLPVWAARMLVHKFEDLQAKFPFIQYATAFAFVHAERAEALGISHEYLVELLEPKGAADEIQYDPVEMIGRSPSLFETWKMAFTRMDYKEWKYPIVESRLIHFAACYNLHSVIRRTAERGCHIDEQDYEGRTSLHFSALLGNESTVSLLLHLGADLEAKTQTGTTALGYAITTRKDSMARFLIKKGAKVNSSVGEYNTMLEAACKLKGSMALIEDLVDHGAIINNQTGATSTALQEAAYAGNEEAVRYLVSNGADVNAKSSEYGTALHAAVLSPAPQRERIIRILLDKKADVNGEGGEFGTPLQAAAQLGIGDNTHIITMLLNEGADVHARGGKFGTALQAACTTSKMNSIKLLLAVEADVNIRGGEFGTALQAACTTFDADSVKLLLAMGADVNIRGGKFETALQAAAHCNIDAVPLLLSEGAHVNVEGGYYGSALQAAVSNGNVATVKMLLEHGANAGIKGGFHGSMLRAAAWGGNEEITSILLDLGADINEQEGGEGSALFEALSFRSERFVKFLLDNGADVNFQGGAEGNVLRTAIQYYPRDYIIKLLLDRGADMHACQPGKYGSAFEKAINKGDLKIVRLLLEHGKNTSPNDEWYRKAVQRANQPGKEQIAELLLQWKVRADLASSQL